MASLSAEIWQALWENYSIVAPYLAPFTNVWSTIITKGWPFVAPWLNQLAKSAHDYPPVVVVGLFLIFVLIVLQIISYIQNIISVVGRWIRNGLILGAIVVVGSVVYKRGLDKTGTELQLYWKDVADFWQTAYKKYEMDANPQKSYGQHAGQYLIAWWNDWR